MPVVGLENKYMVSNKGEVLSNSYRKQGFCRKLAQTNHNGYPHVNLCVNGKMKRFQVHRLVAMAFIPNPDNLPCVNHKDENKSNNHVENLEWCTQKYNNNYGTANKRRGESGQVAIIQLTLDNKFVSKYNSSKEAANANGFCSSSCITAVCKGRQNTAYGYKWIYEDNSRVEKSNAVIERRKVESAKNMKAGGLKHSKPVMQYSLDGEFIKEYRSCQIAAMETGIAKASIQQNCSGFLGKTHGYIFRYK